MTARTAVNSHRPVTRGRGERGMTLMELLVSMAISIILVTLVFQFFIIQSTNFQESRATAEMQQELRWAMNFLTDHLKQVGNGVPPTSGWAIIENTDGVAGAPDSISILGSYKSLVIETTQTMGNEGSQVKVDDSSGIEIGDLAVISDGTFQEIFIVTSINDLHLWHDTYPPWNDDKKLDHRYVSGSSLTIVTYYCFFVEEDEEGNRSLMVQTQAYEPQVLLGDVDDFQIRFKMKDGSWASEVDSDEIYDIRMIEVRLRARSPEPIRDYIDPEFGDEYKRIELKSIVIPKNITVHS